MARIGVIGLGWTGENATTFFLQRDHFVVATGPDPEDREAFEDEYDARTTASIAELLEYPLDGVVVATPNRYHEEHVELALEAGSDVLVHKPIAHSLESAKAIEALAAESDQHCFVDYHFRCTDLVRSMAAAVEDGVFGECYHVEAVFSRTRHIPGIGSWFTSRDLCGGGALNDVGVHWIDTAIYLLDDPTVDRVSGTVRQCFDPHEQGTGVVWEETGSRPRSDVEDSATAYVEFGNGCSLSLEAHWAANQPDRREFRLYGDRAGIAIDWNEETVTTTAPDLADPPVFGCDDWRVTEVPFAAFLRAIDGEETSLSTPSEAVTTQQVVEGVYGNTWLSR
jgi:predicted dehydrogenase